MTLSRNNVCLCVSEARRQQKRVREREREVPDTERNDVRMVFAHGASVCE